ncbi:hypothetical protein [Aporhodopirellula rubra]|nr:hypothetical protein [Aporhodopirellula rubra]
MPNEKRTIRLPRVAIVVRILFALFLFGTGLMTMRFAVNGYPVTETPDDVGRFMMALETTGYLIFWVGLFKTITGGLMFFPRTAPLAVLMSLPYAFNILLYVTFFAHQFLAIGLPDFAACVLLIYCYFDWYRPIFSGPQKLTHNATASVHDTSGGINAL